MDQSQYMKKPTSPLLYVLFVVLIALAGYGLYTFVNNSKADKKKDTNNEQSSNTNTNTNNENTNQDNQQEENNSQDNNTDTSNQNSGNTNDETPVTTDFSQYSTSQQNVGSSSNTSEYTLASVTNTEGSGYHKFVFKMQAKGSTTQTPYVVAKYIASQGVIRMDLNGATTDSSGIGYQKSVDINKKGILRLYHNVSADQTEELYDVGVTKETPFLLTVEEDNSGSVLAWNVNLFVKYPGISLSGTIDLGSTEFSKDAQTITGAEKADGAKVVSYSYSASGGILKVAFTVQGTTTKPIPSAAAGYDGTGKLVLRFPSVSSDVIAKMPAALTMSGGITMVWEMDGANASKYTFNGASKEFKLSATQSPNQVIIEIKL